MIVPDKYRCLLVVGNGFDINVGLKTSYNDFMKWLSDKYESINTISFLYYHLKNKMNANSEKWVDIENELRTYSRGVVDAKTDIKFFQSYLEPTKRFKLEYENICTLLKEYLAVEQSKYNGPSIASEARSFITKLYKQYTYMYIVTFNYTNTLDLMSDAYVHHVHGSLDKEGFVFGIEDDCDINKAHSFLYKTHNRSLNVNHLNERFDDAEHISFFGYSLGQTDHSYFDDFFKQQSSAGCKRKKFDFYFYGQAAYDDLYWQLRTLTGKRIAKFNQFNDVEFIDIKSMQPVR